MAVDALSRTFGALADPTRRAILARLSEGGATVGQIAEPFAMTFAAVSKHLRVLERAGLVTRGREAQFRPAQLDAEPLRAASSWIIDYERFWNDSLGALDGHLAGLAASDDRRPDPTSPHARSPGPHNPDAKGPRP